VGKSDTTTRAGLTRSPEQGPPEWFDIRTDIAARVLAGSGLEIGGLHYPVNVPAGVHVRYVDRMSVDDLRKHYPELNHLPLVDVDIVDDGEQLETVEDGSVDFIIANHFLEHCHDPIATIGNHLRKLAPGGVLFYAVPDKRFTFDIDREPTPLEHMVLDHAEGPERSRAQHFDEWARYVYEDPEEPVRSEDEIRERARLLDEQDYSIHTHVFTQAEVLRLILHCRERYDYVFDVEAAWRRGIELIVVLRKAGPIEPPPAWVAAQHAAYAASAQQAAEAAKSVQNWEAAIASNGSGGSAPEAGLHTSIPLAALRADLIRTHPRASGTWHPAVEIAGVTLPALELDSPDALVYALRLPAGAAFRAKVAAAGEATPGLAIAVRLRGLDGAEVGEWRYEVTGESRAWRDCTVPLPVGPGEYELWLSAIGANRDQSCLLGEPAIQLPATAVPVLEAGPPARTTTNSQPRVLAHSPLISVLMPVHDPQPEFLEAAIASIGRQTFGDWELCLADDGSADPRIHAILDRVVAEDERIRLTRHAPARGIAAATNAALGLATGKYVALVDHDDVIVEDAFETYARLVEQQPLDMVYSDEDRVSEDGSEHSHTFFKPAWSPDFFRTAMYTCHLGLYRRSLAIELGGFRSEFDGSQDYDFVLRVSERTGRIGHVPRVLYSWRNHPRSAASGMSAKPMAIENSCRAIGQHLERIGCEASVERGPWEGWYRVRYAVDQSARVAVVLALTAPPSSERQARAFTRCAQTWSIGADERVEVLLTGSREVLAAYMGPLSAADVDPGLIRFVPAPSGTAPAAALNAAVRQTDSEYICLWPEWLEVRSEGWCGDLVGLASAPGVGVAGGVVRIIDGRVIHGPAVFGDGWPFPAMYGRAGVAFPFLVANFSALSGPIAMRSETFSELGGLNVELGELAFLDLCLRVRNRGLRCALASEAEFGRPSAAPVLVNDPKLLAAFRERWSELGEDPYYNPNFWHGNGEHTPWPPVQLTWEE
jgi:O-antigen biosynthesis protein